MKKHVCFKFGGVEEVHYRIWPAEDILSSNWGEWNPEKIDLSAVIQKD